MSAFRRYGLMALLLGLAGCQSYHEQLIQQGYPPAYADGYHEGCLTGKQAVNGIGASYKDVARYDRERHYAMGWEDGYKQCVVTADNEQRRRYYDTRDRERDEDWERSKRQDKIRALHGTSPQD
ncbi:hypothetical protein IQ22_02171 [Pseudomonas duriflava]|uniref:Lipoprotein n=1 Tax=Pseudomonas duriflava TaxID=459528 RepID=A0A562QC37_9PSED|nr:hypothetical protein [Pseudomonas duriflava]TWI54308.1 hypothetical protein IQ22_02171 [Pseudomonas duriflava]